MIDCPCRPEMCEIKPDGKCLIHGIVETILKFKERVIECKQQGKEADKCIP